MAVSSASRSTPPYCRSKASLQAAEVARVLGTNLKTVRQSRGFSLDRLSEASGVSRAMLGQIETGRSVPTVALIWRVADALGIPVDALLSKRDNPDYVVERKADAPIVMNSAGCFQVRSILPADRLDDTQFQEVLIRAGHTEQVAFQLGVGRIGLIVAKGDIEVAVGRHPPLPLCEGDSISFSAATGHCLSNPGQNDSIIYLVAVGTQRQ